MCAKEVAKCYGFKLRFFGSSQNEGISHLFNI